LDNFLCDKNAEVKTDAAKASSKKHRSAFEIPEMEMRFSFQA